MGVKGWKSKAMGWIGERGHWPGETRDGPSLWTERTIKPFSFPFPDIKIPIPSIWKILSPAPSLFSRSILRPDGDFFNRRPLILTLPEQKMLKSFWGFFPWSFNYFFIWSVQLRSVVQFLSLAFPNPWWRATWNEKAEPHFLERGGVLFFQKRGPEKSNAKKIDLLHW